jgi:hypothetical protein
MLDLLNTEDFGFWVPLTICKSSKETTKGKEGRREIEGIASTVHIDLQYEKVIQAGIDYSYFLEHGFFNNDHKPGFENKVGEPIECRVTKDGLYVRGFLYKEHKIANDIWELAHAIEASGGKRKLGFSIQGKVLRRAGKTILKCWVQDIAITAAPINTHTWLDIVKALTAVPANMWCDESGCYPIAEKAVKGQCECDSCPCSTEKGSLGARGGLAFTDEEMTLRKQQEKALAATSEMGRVLVPESLEGKGKDQDHGRTDPCHCGKGDTCKCKVSKSLTMDDCVALIQQHRNLTTLQAQVVAEAVFHMNGIHA